MTFAEHLITFFRYREPIISCLKESCDCCASGAYSVCPFATCIVRILVNILSVFHHLPQGIGGWGGGLSEYIALDTRYVHILPEGIPCTFIADSIYHGLDIDVD